MEFVEQPITDHQTDEMYDAIFVGLGDGSVPLVDRCDHTLKHTKAWCQDNDADFEAVERWVTSNGGFCDCEVLFNVMPDEDEE